MTEYGVQPTGYVRKPIAVILAEIEALMITEFGPGVVQTSQSPFGQLNGLVADLISEIDERNLEIYQSYDPDQAEGNRLDILGRLRLIDRNNETDAELRKSITNEGQSRVDIQDLSRAIKGLEGVTFVQVFVNETGEVTDFGLESGTISVAVIGGEDSEIAATMRKFVVPGINTYGNTYITSDVEGLCRSSAIIRPVDVPVSLTINAKSVPDKFGCPPPSPTAISETVADGWSESRINGLDPSFYSIRTIIENQFSNIEVIDVNGERDGESFGVNLPVLIGFIEIASIESSNVTVNLS